MGTASKTDGGGLPTARAATAGPFVAAVASALPPAGFWTMPVLVAVSGGADSVALLAALRRLVPAGLERRLIVAHAEHDLRAAAVVDREFVVDLAERMGLACVWRRISVRDADGDEGLEGRARRVRYDFLKGAALEHGARHVVVGHTADDQAETVLLNLMRGAGTTGLAARRPGHDRPLLGLRRSETHALCEAAGITCVVDETNSDPAHQRNRVRHELLPLVAEVSRRDPVPVLVRAADVMRDENDLLDELASSIDPTDARALAAAPLPLARRAVRRWLADPYPPDLATVERVLEVARGLHPGCDAGGNRQIRRSKQRMHIVNLG